MSGLYDGKLSDRDLMRRIYAAGHMRPYDEATMYENADKEIDALLREQSMRAAGTWDEAKALNGVPQ